MFERFTPTARTVVEHARAHAVRLGHRWVGTEHLLLALCEDEQPTSPVLHSYGLTVGIVGAEIAQVCRPAPERDREALAAFGIDLDLVRERIEATFGPGALEAPAPRRRSRRRRRPCPTPAAPGFVPFSPRAKKCLELSLREALRLGQKFIAPEHVALGVLREGEGLACMVLARREVSISALRTTFESAVRRSA